MSKLKHLPFGIYEKALCSNMSLKEKLCVANEAGYDFLEMSIDASEEKISRLYDPEYAIMVRDVIISTNVQIYTLALTVNRSYPLGSENEETREKGIELVKRAIDFSCKAGIRIIHIAAYDEHGALRNCNSENLFKKSIVECVNYASKQGVILALETMDTNFMGSSQRVMEYVRMLDSPYLQVYVDVGNLTAMGIDPSVDLPVGGRHIVGIHLKDTVLNEFRDIPYGKGIVDFPKCFQILSQMKYQGFFVAEMWSHDDPGCLLQIKNAYSFLKDRMGDL